MSRFAICAGAAALLCAATPAAAEPFDTAHQWEAGYLALSAVDAAETIHCLKRHECEEGNPIFGKHPSAAKLIAGKLILGAVQYSIFERMYDRNPRAALRYAQISVGIQGAVVGFNARIFFK